MTRLPLHGIFLGLAGAWLATLGACGRTAVGFDEYSTGASGDDDDSTSGKGGSSARGGSSSATGGSSRGGSTSSGGSTSKGGSGVGGSLITSGGTSGNSTGAGGTTIGGSSFGGGGGDIALGGSVGIGGSFAVGGSLNVGGTFAMGGSTSAGAGGSNPNGGMGAVAGAGPGGVSCGDYVCDPGASVCCSRRSEPSFCTYPGADCDGATLTCSGPGTCAAGEVCCYHALFSSCAAECDVSEGETGNPPTILLCDSTADCGPDQTCVMSPRGIAYCGDNL